METRCSSCSGDKSCCKMVVSISGDWTIWREIKICERCLLDGLKQIEPKKYSYTQNPLKVKT